MKIATTWHIRSETGREGRRKRRRETQERMAGHRQCEQVRVRQ